MVALTAITLYNSLQSGITELRGEQAKLNELRGDFVRKDEFNTRIAANYDRIGTLQTQNSTQNAAVVSLKTEIDGVKERLAKSATEIEGVKKDLATIEVVKERLTALAAELKLAREESMKAKADVEKNLLADQERKAQRDTQYKDLEKAIKDLQTTLQECQVKLARIEGQQQAKPAEKAKDAP
jgi:chromosome segregation ATPase